MKLKFIDLFAGIGGMRIPFEDLGGECVFSSEWDEYAQKTYFDNFGEMPQGDITKIDEADIPEHDILLAGFPCQPFSVIGDKRDFQTPEELYSLTSKEYWPRKCQRHSFLKT